MVRQAGLQHQQSWLLAPPGPARYLHQGLRQPLRPAELLGEKALIGVDHAHQSQAGEVMPLGEHLGAEQDAVMAIADAAQDVLQPSPAAHVVAIHARQRYPGKTHGKLLFQPFGSAADRVEAGPALFAAQRRPAPGAAMMTKEPVAPAVEDHARIAMSAFLGLAAVRTHEHRGETAAIEVQQHLRAGLELLGHRPDQGLAQAILGRVPVEVHQPGHRRSGAGYFPGQTMTRVTPFLNIQQRLQRRRRRSENHGDFLFRGPHHRQVPGLVAETILLLVGGIVLLVDHNQAQRGAWREHGRTGADHKPGAARTGVLPGAQALAFIQSRMQHRRRGVEAGLEAGRELWRKPDLRRQEKALAARCQHLFHQVQIDFGLAAGRHAVQQVAGELLAGRHGLDGRGLLRAERERAFAQQLGGRLNRRLE